MRRPFRPRTRGFRAVLAMALLAWTVMASGVLMAAPGMQAAMTMTAAQNMAPDCNGMSMQHAAAHRHVPAAPMGHGDCCQGGCHCLSACNAVLSVPGLRIATSPPQSSPAFPVQAGFVQAMAAPPLRPPIA